MLSAQWMRRLAKRVFSGPVNGSRRTGGVKRPVNSVVQSLETRSLLTVSVSLSANAVNESDTLAARTITITATNDVAVAANETVDVAVAGLVEGAANDFTLSGTQITILAGQTTGSVTLVVNDDSLVELTEIGTISLINPSAGLVVDAVNGSAALTVNDNDQATISIDDVTIAEGNAGTTAFTFTVTLTGSVDAAVAVNYATADNTATTADQDYTATAGTLNFSANTATPQTRQLTVLVNGDQKSEPNETFFVNLATLVAGGRNVVIADNQGLGTINNDDQATISINDVTLAEGNTGTTAFVFTVTLTGVVDNAVAVDFATANGTATVLNQDYTATSGTLNFTANAASPQTRQVTVLVNGDQIVELNETLFVNLTNIVAGGRDVVFADNQGLGTINNDDQATISITDVALAEGNAGNTAFNFTVTLTGVVDTAVAVNFATADGTATTGDQDYTAANGTLNFTAATASPQTRTATVQVIGDQKVEVNQTFLVNLLNLNAAGRNVIIADNQGLGTINNDDRANVTLTPATATQAEGGSVDITATVDLAVDGGFSILVNLSADGANVVESAELVGQTNADFSIGLGDGTAVAGNANAVRLNFFGAAANTTNAPNTARRFTVQLTNDTIVEGIEKLKATLGTITAALVPTADVNRLTTDDESKVSISQDANDRATVTVQNVAVMENAGPAGFTATLTGTVEGGFQIPSFSVAHGDGTGTDEQTEAGDWTFTSVALPFLPNQQHFVTNGQAQNFSVNLRNDTFVELDENFSVSLAAAAQAATGERVDAGVLAPTTLISVSGAVGTIQNDDTLISVTETGDNSAITSVSDRNALSRSEDNDSNDYSLREAILLSNAARGDQKIQFTGNSFSGVVNPQIALQATLPMVSAPVEIEGPANSRPDDMLKLKGAAAGRILPVSTSGVVSISGLHFTEGKASGTGNAVHGGALGIFGSGTVNITDSQFSWNTAVSGNGGAIFVQNTSRLNISGSTFWRNTAVNGGAIYVNGTASSAVSGTNSTFYLNSGTTSGGMLFINNASANVSLSHITAADNIAGTAAGAAAIARQSAASLSINNSIVAINNNVRRVLNANVVATSDITGAFTGGSNLLWTGIGTAVQGAANDPLLSGLMDAGGRTLVMLPSNFLAGVAYRSYATGSGNVSPAINKASASSVAADQRGVARPGTQRDIGAVEVQDRQSRFIEVQSISSGSAVTVDWETTEVADRTQSLSGQSAPGDTVALDLLLTADPSGVSTGATVAGGAWRNIQINGVSGVVELVGTAPASNSQKLRLRLTLPSAIQSATRGVAARDAETNFVLSGLTPGSYRLEILGLNRDNLVSGGGYVSGFRGIFTVSSPPSGSVTSSLNFAPPLSAVDSLFARKDDLFLL